MNKKLRHDVAVVMISAINSRMQGGMPLEVISELIKIRTAWEAVRDQATNSQPEPDDFKQGEPGVASCQCEQCVSGPPRSLLEAPQVMAALTKLNIDDARARLNIDANGSPVDESL
jgi:hypothetical protein